MGGGGGDVSTTSYYKYRIRLSHQNIDPNSNIYAYDANGTLSFSVAPNDPNMNYGAGIYTVPGSRLNLTIESLATATYWVSYSTEAVRINYDDVTFEISNTIMPNPIQSILWGTFEYFAVYTPQEGSVALADGKWDTQLQTIFYAEPPSDYVYAIVDFGRIVPIQALDIIAGFFKPDDTLEFDIGFTFTLQYSNDSVNYYNISSKTSNVQLSGGESISFEESDLGVGFEARYFRILLNNVKKINYSNEKITINSGNRQTLIDTGIVEESKATIGDIITVREGIYSVAFTEISAYSNIIIKAESKLIPTTTLTEAVGVSDTTINVVSTASFNEPGSGETDTAYLDKDENKSFTYVGLTPTSFIGVELSSGVSADDGAYVTQTIETASTVYDNDGILVNLGDRVFKENKAGGEDLFTESQLEYLSKEFLREFYKNHNKLSVDVLYQPFLKVGQTISLTDSYNNLSNALFFIESIANNNGNMKLTLARYP